MVLNFGGGNTDLSVTKVYKKPLYSKACHFMFVGIVYSALMVIMLLATLLHALSNIYCLLQ